jgi:serine/threonine-protein kinase RsbW
MKPDTIGKNVVLTVPAMPAYLDTIRLAMYGVAAQNKYSFEAIEDMKVAVTEACNHALLQMKETDSAELRIAFEPRAEELCIRIQLEGQRIGFAELSKEAEEPEVAIAFHPEQVGLYLMQALVDEVTVVHAGNGNDEVVLCKKRS